MNIPFQLIAVFTDRQRGALGNISAVLTPEEPLSEADMQRIAADMNQPATTYLRSKGGSHTLRWFAPDAEIGLCGHGTAAAVAHLLGKKHAGEEGKYFTFSAGKHSPSGFGNVATHEITISLDVIPVVESVTVMPQLEEALGLKVEALYSTGNKHIALVGSEEKLKAMKPNWHLLRTLQPFGYAVTAPGSNADFVSRTLVPKVQQLEDPATGSSHAALAPFWAGKLGKSELLGIQLSARGGVFRCRVHQGRVQLTGHYEVLAEGTYHFAPGS